MSNVRNALKLPECPHCGSGAGDPCRTPSWRTRKPHAARLPVFPLWAEYLLRREVINLNDEEDDGESDEGIEYTRITPAGTVGVVVEVRPADDTPDNFPIDVVFATGAWIRLTRTEIGDADQYRLGRVWTPEEVDLWRAGLP